MLVPLLMISTNILPSDLWQMAAAALCLHFVYSRLHSIVSVEIAVQMCIFSWILMTFINMIRYQSMHPHRSLWATFVLSNFTSFSTYWNNHELHGGDALVPRANRVRLLLVGLGSRSLLDTAHVSSRLNARLVLPQFLSRMPGVSALLGRLGSCEEFQLMCYLRGEEVPVVVLPGGQREAFADHEDRCKVNWESEPAFARLLMSSAFSAGDRASIRILPFYTKNRDRLFYGSAGWYTTTGRLMNKYLRESSGRQPSLLESVKIVICFGLSMGLFLFPRPVKLDSYLGPELRLREGEAPAALADRTACALQSLVLEAERLPRRHFEHIPGMLPMLRAGMYGLYVMLHAVAAVTMLAAMCSVLELVGVMTRKVKSGMRCLGPSAAVDPSLNQYNIHIIGTTS